MLVGARARRRPRVGAWVLLTVVLSAAFFLLIYSRIALDRSAFVLQEINRQMEVEEARYWELRLEAAELQAPERIVARAQEMGLVYPAERADHRGSRHGLFGHRDRRPVGRPQGAAGCPAMTRPGREGG